MMDLREANPNDRFVVVTHDRIHRMKAGARGFEAIAPSPISGSETMRKTPKFRGCDARTSI
jgi:hypothetical protein